MEERQRKPGSVRLTEEQYHEMEKLGIDNKSAYVKYKLNGAQQHLQVLRSERSAEDSIDKDQSFLEIQSEQKSTIERLPQSNLNDRLALQRLSLENDQLKSKLDELT